MKAHLFSSHLILFSKYFNIFDLFIDWKKNMKKWKGQAQKRENAQTLFHHTALCIYLLCIKWIKIFFGKFLSVILISLILNMGPGQLLILALLSAGCGHWLMLPTLVLCVIITWKRWKSTGLKSLGEHPHQSTMCLYWHLQPSLRFQLVMRRLLSTMLSQ